jgi:DNA-binding LacI/PurR family transcriptional regulator
MTRLRRITVIDQAEGDIEKRVRAGEWPKRLPGFKVLAELVGVSVPTIGIAIARLAARGILVSQGPRRPFVVAPGLAHATKIKPKSTSNYLIIISQKSLGDMDIWTRNLVIDLMRNLTREGWRCDLDEINYGAGRNISRTLDGLRQKHAASHFIFIGGGPAISDWAVAQLGLNVAFFGGKSNHAEVPAIGVSMTVIYGHILESLSKLGHHRVMVWMNGMHPAVASIMARLHAAHFHFTPESLDTSGLFQNTTITSLPQRKEAFLKAFRKTKPTAIIVDGLFEHILIHTTLLEQGLKSPADVSLVNLSSEDEFDKLCPIPTHLQVDRQFMLREIHAWIRGRRTDGIAAARRVIANWVQGETLGPAPKK